MSTPQASTTESPRERAGPRLPERPPWRAPAGWRDVLAEPDPDALLEALIERDPLHLRALVADTLRADALLVDADRVHLRALARIAHAASLDGPPRRAAWIVDRVDESVSDVLASERAAVVAGRREAARSEEDTAKDEASEPREGDATFAVFARPLGLTGAELRGACDAFNRRSLEERSAFFQIVLDRRPVEDAARIAEATPSDLARGARRALEAALAGAEAFRSDAEEGR